MTSRHQPLQHYALNQKQLDILDILYRFRFATTNLLAKSLGKKDQGEMNRRLRTLVDQEYIGRKYEPNYHLQGRPASFHLLPKGIKTLREHSDVKYVPSILHNIYKDKTASDRFINHWLSVFDAYCQLKSRYGERMRCFTKPELTKFEYFPNPLPDMYIRLDNGGDERQFIINTLEASQPIFVHLKLIKQYIEYAEEGDWEDATGTDVPAMIFVCESKSLESKLLRLIRWDDDIDEDDLPLEVTVLNSLTEILDTKKKARLS